MNKMIEDNPGIRAFRDIPANIAGGMFGRAKNFVDTKFFAPVPVPQGGAGTSDRIGETRPGLSPRGAALASGMFGRVKKTAYLPWWYFRSRILNQKRPLQTVLFVTDYCNLKCRHCMDEGHQGSRMKPYEEIRQELEYSYRQGSRFIDFEGGEPTLWRDSQGRGLNDLYRLAKEVGFWSCTLTTNGQRPFGDTLADSVWVSVDGYGKYHDRIRGKGTFAKLDKNIRESGHPALSIAMAVNNRNKDSVGKLIRYTKENPAIQQIAFNFHTPFPGTESLMMDWDERNEVIDRIIAYKKRGYPIMNSISGLKIMKKRGFPKDCWIANYILIDGRKLPNCPGSVLGACDDCGFSMAGEMYSVLRMKPDTIFAGLQLRM